MIVNDVSEQIRPFTMRVLAKAAARPSPSVDQISVAQNFSSHLSNLEKLRAPSKGNGASKSLLENVLAAADPEKSKKVQTALSSLNGKRAETGIAMVALEGALLTKFVDQMLPKSSHALYGKGLAGDTWRGFEVEQLGKTLASSDPLRLAAAAPVLQLAANIGTNSLFGNDAKGLLYGKSISPFAN